jgi:hypothetical protein
MLYELMIQGENERWETFKKAEREAQHRAARRAVAGGSRLRKLAAWRRRGVLAGNQVDELARDDDRLANLTAVQMRLHLR